MDESAHAVIEEPHLVDPTRLAVGDDGGFPGGACVNKPEAGGRQEDKGRVENLACCPDPIGTSYIRKTRDNGTTDVVYI